MRMKMVKLGIELLQLDDKSVHMFVVDKYGNRKNCDNLDQTIEEIADMAYEELNKIN